MSDDNNLNNETDKGLERFEEFMDNNSFDIEIEPASEPEVKEAVKSNESEKPEDKYAENSDDPKPPVVQPKKGKGKAWVILFLLACAVIIIIAAVSAHNKNVPDQSVHIKQTDPAQIREAWESCIALSSIEYDGYDAMSQDEQLKIDSQVLLYLAERRNYFSRNEENDFEFTEVLDSYIDQSKGGYRANKKDVIYWVDQISSFDVASLEKNIKNNKQQHVALSLMKLMDQSDTLKEIANNAYPDEMQEGCIRIVMTADDRYDFYRSRAQVDYGSFTVETVDKAKAWLTEHNVDYETKINALFDSLQAEYEEETSEQGENANPEESSSDESAKTEQGTSYSSGTDASGSGSSSVSVSGSGSFSGGASGGWKPNSGSGAAGSGKTPKTN